MSLIHDALKSMDAPQESRPAAVRAPAAAARRRPAWLDALLAFAVVLGAGVLGWWLWQSQTTSPASTARVAAAPTAPADPSAQPVVVPPPATDIAAPAQLEAAPLAEPAAPPLAGTATVPSATAELLPSRKVEPPSNATHSEALVATVARAGVQPSPAPTAPRTAPARRARQAKAEAAPAAPVVDDTPVELRFARFVAAMKDARTADAERELAALRERLPAGSLGLLRAQAWFDLRAGRDATAADGYRAILDRMPGDEEAAVNLASIQARQQKPEEARATLDAAARVHPDSNVLRAALAQFTPAARQ
jgi:hypothetical protein